MPAPNAPSHHRARAGKAQENIMSKVLIIGASRGLGFGLAHRYLERGWEVMGTERLGRKSSGLQALQAQDSRLTIEHVDIDSERDIMELASRLRGHAFDLVFINAGTLGDANAPFATQVEQVMKTNVAGAMTAARALCGLVRHDGALAVMSSGLGSISGNVAGGWEPYRSSKAALNQSLRSFAVECADAQFSLTAVAPGWVRTEMGGDDAPLDVETSTGGIAKMLESRLGARGLAFLDYRSEILPW